MLNKNKILKVSITILMTIIFAIPGECKFKQNVQDLSTELITDITHINISLSDSKNIKKIENLIKNQNPKALYVEQWITVEKGNEKFMQNLYKIAHKHNVKVYIFIGKDSWFGRKGLVNSLTAYDQYGKYIDGVILKAQPNRTNIWKKNLDFQAQILNQMLDAYLAIHLEAKKRNKQFIADFPFWFSDYQGPKKNFSENVCDYADKVIFLIDDLDKLQNLDIKWNNITCPYNIDLTKHATLITDDDISDMYKTIKSKLSFYSNFNGFIVDSDTQVDFKKLNEEIAETRKNSTKDISIETSEEKDKNTKEINTKSPN